MQATYPEAEALMVCDVLKKQHRHGTSDLPHQTIL